MLSVSCSLTDPGGTAIFGTDASYDPIGEVYLISFVLPSDMPAGDNTLTTTIVDDNGTVPVDDDWVTVLHKAYVTI